MAETNDIEQLKLLISEKLKGSVVKFSDDGTAFVNFESVADQWCDSMFSALSVIGVNGQSASKFARSMVHTLDINESGIVAVGDVNSARQIVGVWPDDRTTAIEALYSEIAKINSERAMRPDAPDLKVALDKAMSELRRLQSEEASEIERLPLALPLGEGARAIADADALLAKYENPPFANSASSGH